MKSLKIAALAALLTSSMLAAAPASALVWSEANAGDLPASAEITTGAGLPALTGITGSLTSMNLVNIGPVYQVDLFKIYVADAVNFTASVVSPTVADTVLFLFDAQGHGAFSNDDFDGSLLSTLPTGIVSTQGHYFLGIGLTGSFAQTGSGADLFMSDGWPTGAGPLARWSVAPAFEELPYAYTINIAGATVAAVPEPAVAWLLLLGAGGLAAGRSLRRGLTKPA
jgi:hypothetical protein